MFESLVSFVTFFLWTLMYYFMYYTYITSKEDVLGYYAQWKNRVVPYVGFATMTLITQFISSLLLQISVCESASNIMYSFLRMGSYIWFIALFLLGIVIHQYPSIKHIFSETIVHQEKEANDIIKEMFMTSNENIANEKLKTLMQNILCYFNNSNGGNNTTCNVDFVRKINLQNYAEYFELLSPLLNEKTATSNQYYFLKYCLKKDVISEMIWVLQIGILVIYFLSLRSSQKYCTNYDRSQQEKIEEYIKSQQAK